MSLSRFKNMFIDEAINKAIIKINFAFATIETINLMPKKLKRSFILNNISKFILNDKSIKPHF